MLENKYNKGFTLIEIVAILILIGILMAVAASKYFDMRDEAQKRAALATVAEAQSRINSVFAEKILGGDSCTVARDYASKLENIADGNSAPYVFGDYYLEKAGTGDGDGDSDVFKVNVGLISETPERTITTATLYLPECGSKNENDPTNPTDPTDPTNPTDPTDPTGNGDWWLTNEQIVDIYGQISWIDITRELFELLDGRDPDDPGVGDLLRDAWTNIISRLADGAVFTLGDSVFVKPIWNILGVESGTYVNIGDSGIQKLDSSSDKWARYDSENGSWTKSPEKGNYYLQKNGEDKEVYIYIGDGSGDIQPPTEGAKDWVKLQYKK